jgi:hypothetical protein
MMTTTTMATEDDENGEVDVVVDADDDEEEDVVAVDYENVVVFIAAVVDFDDVLIADNIAVVGWCLCNCVRKT